LTSAADQEAFDPKGLEEKFETVAGVDRSVARGPSRMNDAETRLSTLIR